MLTETERERLINREKEKDTAITHRNDLIARTKLQKWIDDIPDILFILEHLPERQIKKKIVDGNAFQLQYISEILMKILDFSPIRGQINAPDKWMIKTNRVEREATNEDITRSVLVDAHRRTLFKFSDLIDPATIAAEWLLISPEERKYRIRASGAEPEKIKEALDRVLEAMKPKGEPPK